MLQQVRTAAHTADAVAEPESVQQLRAWIEDNGGYVHPALELEGCNCDERVGRHS